MRALVVYESMYGNTHTIAGHIGDGLATAYDVAVVPVGDATDELVRACDLLVCGGPTHAHGVTSSATRKAAVTAADKPGSGLDVDPAAGGEGLRDWFHGLSEGADTLAAAFDTRADGPAALTGRASKGIARRLRNHGFRLVVEPESFVVDKQNHLLAGEADRATAWGAALATLVAAG